MVNAISLHYRGKDMVCEIISRYRAGTVDEIVENYAEIMEEL
jgi:hypothetical protein